MKSYSYLIKQRAHCINILIVISEFGTLIFKFVKISRIAEVKVYYYVTTTPHFHVKLIERFIIPRFARHIEKQSLNYEIL